MAVSNPSNKLIKGKILQCEIRQKPQNIKEGDVLCYTIDCMLLWKLEYSRGMKLHKSSIELFVGFGSIFQPSLWVCSKQIL